MPGNQLHLASDLQRPMPQFSAYAEPIAESRPDEPGEVSDVSISKPDRAAGSAEGGRHDPRNPQNHGTWTVSAAYFVANFEPC